MQTPVALTSPKPQALRRTPFVAPNILGAMAVQTYAPAPQRRSVLAWHAGWRVAAVLPALLMLWLSVAWALVEVTPL